MILDKDLLSIQEARNLAANTKEAQLEFQHFNQQQVDKIIKSMAEAGYEASEKLAKMACDESGFGVYRDKIIKNQFSTKDVFKSIKNLKTVGIIAEEADGKVLKIAVPMGVVCALVPSTNPTSTAMFKALISLKSRNGIVASPHPRTAKCTAEALKILSEAAENAGAPKGLVQCMKEPTIEGTNALMQDKNIAVILATGSNPMVKAAYSSGKPAYGVGSGNVPAFIERSANYQKAVADIVYGTTFDNGTLCSSEQSMIVDLPLKEKVIEEAKLQCCYFVNAEEKEKLARAIQNDFRINPDIVGKPATFIADYAGFSVPENTKVLVANCFDVGRSEPLSIEKLSPILSFYVVDGWLEGCHRCIDLLKFGGIGHTMVIHSNDEPIIMKFALEKPAFRILVNTVASVGAVGYTTSLDPSMTLGPGTWGGSIISDNVTAKHLMNVKSLAFETNPVNKGKSVDKFETQKYKGVKDWFMKEIEERLKERAGNPPLKDIYTYQEKVTTAVQPEVERKPITFGSGITEEEIQKIIKEFS
ncbi:MAG: aldehyde dehydrogenase family protein [Ignavibacteria bacterium]|nr:aldehyde dehydrogenase family protein [Ignavibacteria bacterium]MBT8381943.1 aldehyde dehydrogenase family protein [Ignavibacteria bacterium]MBT8392780.1 aldehyde dehydrogenase family protein [Ignavibacteria bacterium]NNJ54341.1 aldehyde dehydrogenase family protein [Ignavibacteriaceae bacterium]NNL22025.1 aldehyde dehydrogenase family protein [Ignavibacteriaceae bacterium]